MLKGGVRKCLKEVSQKIYLMDLFLFTIYRGPRPNWLITKRFFKEKCQCKVVSFFFSFRNGFNLLHWKKNKKKTSHFLGGNLSPFLRKSCTFNDHIAFSLFSKKFMNIDCFVLGLLYLAKKQQWYEEKKHFFHHNLSHFWTFDI